MEKHVFKKLFTATWVALLFTFCHLASAATNVSVTATPSNPIAPATVTLAASGDSDGNPIMVTKVEYFNGTASLGVSVQAPFTLTLNNLAAGAYQISVKVTTTDPANPVLQSAPLAVTVGMAPGAATAYFIHTDQLNTPRAITNGSGNLVWQWDSDPFGNETPNEQPTGQPTFTFNQRFPGQQFDRESNLHYNYHRDYDPSMGRYIESDPIGLQGGISTYGYVLQNPISYKDPKGLLVVVDDAVIIGGVIITSACIATPACRKAVSDAAAAAARAADAAANSCKAAASAFGNWMENRVKNPPDVGPPGGWIQGPRRGRQYGPDGKPVLDIDKPHQGNEEDHAHEWPDGVREEPGRPVSPWPPSK